MDRWKEEKEEIRNLVLAIKGCTKEEFAANISNLEYITVCSSDNMEEEKILMPEQLSYYLKTHFCGSNRMHDNLIERGGQAVKDQIKDILGV